MEITQTYAPVATNTTTTVPVYKRFINWCAAQEENRLAWVAAIIFSHGCIITPLTLLFVMLSGNSFVFWPFVIGAMGASLIANLAAMPTKWTLPVYFLGILVDIVIILQCIGVLLAS